MVRVTVADLMSWLDRPDAADLLPADRAVVVDLDSQPARWSPGVLPAVLVGVGPAADVAGVDVMVDERDLPSVLTRVAAHPLAATGLALLLRHAAARDTAAGLIAESTTYSMLQAGPEFTAWRESRLLRVHPPEPDVVLVERAGDVLTVTLNRPGVRNALDRAMRDGLVEALAIAVLDPALRVQLRGAGPAFCAGGDLEEFGQRPDPATAHLVRLHRSPAVLLDRLGDRVTAWLHGACVGSGIELPAFAGRVVAAPDTRISLPELGLGLIPGAGGTVSLTRRIGRHRTMWLALTGATIDAETALAWGLVDAVQTTRSRH